MAPPFSGVETAFPAEVQGRRYYANCVWDALGVPAALGARIQMQYYEAGHMMYVNPPSIAKLKRDLDAFIDLTARR